MTTEAEPSAAAGAGGMAAFSGGASDRPPPRLSGGVRRRRAHPLAGSFAERWSQQERDLGVEDLASEMVACGHDVLPASAAPCLTFKEAARPAPIWEAFAASSD